MAQITSLAKLRVPLGGQEIELQEVDYAETGGAGEAAAAQGAGVPIRLLRTRIREKSRFTVFEIDAATAAAWGEVLLAWARRQPGGGEHA